jgi:hypothetical protein
VKVNFYENIETIAKMIETFDWIEAKKRTGGEK